MERRSRRAGWLVLTAWLVVAVLAGPLAAGLPGKLVNDAVTFLPQGAQSTEAAHRLATLPDGDASPALVVYHRDGGLEPADHALAERQLAAVNSRYPGPAPAALIPAKDGTALLFTVPLSGDEETVSRALEDVRATVGDPPRGLEVKVTGPAAIAHDLDAVFETIDGTLLIAVLIVVIVLLLAIYRSPALWLAPIVAAGGAAMLANAVVSALASAGLTVNSQANGILLVLVFGVATDYALLLIARYREELHRHPDVAGAMAAALRGAGPTMLASAGTVATGLLCLLAADLNNTRALAVTGAVGVLCALVAMLTLLPALLVVAGRRLFWPFVPRFSAAPVPTPARGWERLGNALARRPRRAWVGTALLLAALVTGLATASVGVAEQDSFTAEPEAVAGQRLVGASYPSGSTRPVSVVARADHADAVSAAVTGTPGVAEVRPGAASGRWAEVTVVLDATPDSAAERATVGRLRARVAAVAGADAVVGGPAAENIDQSRAAGRDLAVVVPLVLLAVFVILALLLRALVAPAILVGTVLLSFAATLGAATVFFDRVLGFPALDTNLPLLAFVFLVALGVDYTIFLMHRIRQESASLGTAAGTVRGLGRTGGVITSAGVVLAATFATLAVLPLVALVQVGVVVAVGVLVDTLVVRSVLVPALTLDLGSRVWWPSRTGAAEPVEDRPPVPISV
jgi:RND superfamily putative drug exporter